MDESGFVPVGHRIISLGEFWGGILCYPVRFGNIFLNKWHKSVLVVFLIPFHPQHPSPLSPVGSVDVKCL